MSLTLEPELRTQALQYKTITCPYCGSNFDVEIDLTAADLPQFSRLQREDGLIEQINHGMDQKYYEDCQICCSPIELAIHINDMGKVELHTRRGNT